MMSVIIVEPTDFFEKLKKSYGEYERQFQSRRSSKFPLQASPTEESEDPGSKCPKRARETKHRYVSDHLEILE